jgi:hypothetical protein
VDAVGSNLLIPETEETADDGCRLYCSELGGAKFSAVNDGCCINLGSGQVYLGMFSYYHDLHYLSDPVILMKKELYVG